jgi:hypothetical protein
VPTLEVVVYDQGRRRTFHLAGVQAAVSYGIACLDGQGRHRSVRALRRRRLALGSAT